MATIQDLAAVKQHVVEAVAPQGAAVLNADAPLVSAMASACAGEVIYFSRVAHSRTLAAHCAAGGRGVVAVDGAIWLRAHNAETMLIELKRLPWTDAGRIGFQVENALAATAAAWAAGLNPALIALGLATFTTDEWTPGRLPSAN
jgi:cyanophycin synthetase